MFFLSLLLLRKLRSVCVSFLPRLLMKAKPLVHVHAPDVGVLFCNFKLIWGGLYFIQVHWLECMMGDSSFLLVIIPSANETFHDLGC